MTLNQCMALALYTLNITKNDKTFSLYETIKNDAGEVRKTASKVREAMLLDIVRHATDIYKHAFLANEIRVNTARDWARREDYQRSAIEGCNLLLVSIAMAKITFHLRSQRVIYWTDMAVKTRAMLRAWRESDKKRYQGLHAPYAT